MSERGLDALRITQRSAQILRIMTAAAIVMTSVLAILAGIASFPILMPYPPPFPPGLLSVAIFSVNLLMYVPFCLFALQYQRHLRTVVNTGDAAALERALWAGRRFWTFGGVIVFAWTALCILAVIGIIVASIVVAARHT